MFVLINFYFRQDEFLCLPLSFFEDCGVLNLVDS